MGTSVSVSFHVPREYLEEIDRLVAEGRYMCRAEFIRYAIRQLIERLRDPIGFISYSGEVMFWTAAMNLGVYMRAVKRRRMHVVQKPAINTRALARRLLREYIRQSIRQGFRANVMNHKSPVVISLGLFKQFIWEKSKGDPRLAALVVKTYMNGRQAEVIGRAGRQSVVTYVWVNYVRKYLAKLKEEGKISSYWRRGRKYYIIPAEGAIEVVGS